MLPWPLRIHPLLVLLCVVCAWQLFDYGCQFCGLQHAYGEEWGVSLDSMTRGKPWSCLLSYPCHDMMGNLQEYLPLATPLCQVGAERVVRCPGNVKASARTIITRCLQLKQPTLSVTTGSKKINWILWHAQLHGLGVPMFVSLSMWVFHWFHERFGPP